MSIFKKTTIVNRFVISLILLTVTFIIVIFASYQYYKNTSSYYVQDEANSQKLKKDINITTTTNQETLKIFGNMQDKITNVNTYYSDLSKLRKISSELSMLSFSASEKRKIERLANELKEWRDSEAAKDIYIEDYAEQFNILANVLVADPNPMNVNNIKQVIEDITGKVIDRALKSNKKFISDMKSMDEQLASINEQLAENQSLLRNMDKKREKSIQSGNRTVVVLLVGIIVVMVIIAVMLLIMRFFTKDINKITSYLHKSVSDAGVVDLRESVQYEENSKDEIDFISKSLDHLFDSVKQSITQALNAAKTNTKHSEELGEASSKLISSIEKQLKHIDGLNELVQDVGKNLDKSEHLAIQTTEDLEDNQQVMNKFVNHLNGVIETITTSSARQNDITVKMAQLTEDAKKTKDVLSLISDIAEQTDLLALNATIEAARAGEHGKGFSVVADEVRKLAEKTQKSLNEINTTINLILQGIDYNNNEIADINENISRASESAQELVEFASNSQERVNNSVKISSEVVRSNTYIAQRTKELIEDMKQTVSVSVNNKKLGTDLQEISKGMSNLADKLNSDLQRFKV
ncbi:MAG: methyl-accepting chemotaxis protein [Campylobacterales bacterium]